MSRASLTSDGSSPRSDLRFFGRCEGDTVILPRKVGFASIPNSCTRPNAVSTPCPHRVIVERSITQRVVAWRREPSGDESERVQLLRTLEGDLRMNQAAENAESISVLARIDKSTNGFTTLGGAPLHFLGAINRRTTAIHVMELQHGPVHARNTLGCYIGTNLQHHYNELDTDHRPTKAPRISVPWVGGSSQ